jgi:hypothetical protein
LLLFNGRNRIIDLFSAGQTYSEIAVDVRVDTKTVLMEYIEYLKFARPSM